jgi:hypothetical protein
VPFQAGLGATGLLCAPADQHSREAASTHVGHDLAAASEHHGDAAARITIDGPVPDSNAVGSDDAADKGEMCSAYCVSAVAMPVSGLAVPPPHAALRVSSIVDPDVVSHAGDALFRPPRSV